MGYCGADSIEKLLSSKFVKITSSGMADHPHENIYYYTRGNPS